MSSPKGYHVICYVVLKINLIEKLQCYFIIMSLFYVCAVMSYLDVNTYYVDVCRLMFDAVDVHSGLKEIRWELVDKAEPSVEHGSGHIAVRRPTVHDAKPYCSTLAAII